MAENTYGLGFKVHNTDDIQFTKYFMFYTCVHFKISYKLYITHLFYETWPLKSICNTNKIKVKNRLYFST